VAGSAWWVSLGRGVSVKQIVPGHAIWGWYDAYELRKFFDSVNHEWLLQMTAHRVADQHILRLIRLWLEAGVLEDGTGSSTEVGTPQGTSTSRLQDDRSLIPPIIPCRLGKSYKNCVVYLGYG
jgi:retron-type reverse transcriptase